MNRLLVPLISLAIFAVACGSDAVDVLTELGLTEDQANCFTSEYEDRGLDLKRILTSETDTELTDDERAEVVEIARLCTSDDQIDKTTDSTETTQEASGDGLDPSGVASARDYESLNTMERLFVDSLTEESGDEAVGLCILGQFQEAGISLFELATAGTDGSDPSGELTSTIFDAMFRCGDELADSDLFSGDAFGEGGFFSGGQGDANLGSVYGDNAELDVLWDQCDAGDGAACDELYWTSPGGSPYEDFGNTCGDRMASAPFSCAEALLDQTSTGGVYGDDPALDALYDECSIGNSEACDTLYWDAPLGSQYEAYGSTCGNVVEEGTYGNCVDTATGTYGSDATFDAMYDACGAGDMAQCDDLYLSSPFSSQYETFGNSCGGRSQDDLYGGCLAALG